MIIRITSVTFLFLISGLVKGQEVTKIDQVNLQLISDISGGIPFRLTSVILNHCGSRPASSLHSG